MNKGIKQGGPRGGRLLGCGAESPAETPIGWRAEAAQSKDVLDSQSRRACISGAEAPIRLRPRSIPRLSQECGTGLYPDRAHQFVPEEAAVDGLSGPVRPESANRGETGRKQTQNRQEIAKSSGFLYADSASWRFCRLFANSSEAPKRSVGWKSYYQWRYDQGYDRLQLFRRFSSSPSGGTIHIAQPGCVEHKRRALRKFSVGMKGSQILSLHFSGDIANGNNRDQSDSQDYQNDG